MEQTKHTPGPWKADNGGTVTIHGYDHWATIVVELPGLPYAFSILAERTGSTSELSVHRISRSAPYAQPERISRITNYILPENLTDEA